MKFTEHLIIRKDLEPFKDKIENFIENSGCQEIKFESLDPRCGGISLPNECIISKKILGLPRETLLYILFHEISHQYQYKKWGRDFMLDIYLKLPIDEAVIELLRVESTADRLAILKLRSLVGDKNLPPYRYYGCQNLEFFKKYLENLRERIKGLTSIDEINKIIKELYS